MGLLGVAVDPRVGSSDRFIYLYYTDKQGSDCREGNRANRVSRFFMAGDGSIDPKSEQILIDRIPAPGRNHNSGDLQFGSDGLLYVSVGDGEGPAHWQDAERERQRPSPRSAERQDPAHRAWRWHPGGQPLYRSRFGRLHQRWSGSGQRGTCRRREAADQEGEEAEAEEAAASAGRAGVP
ncbi:MAG: PQQ-dependent sugar dehydrogenase [Thermomicrobiales bacterium]|nr:PQQ-dependent sugar dehydrogenase [Thermomicrobiales bacterium]